MKRNAWVWFAIVFVGLGVACRASTPGRPYSCGGNRWGKLGYGWFDNLAYRFSRVVIACYVSYLIAPGASGGVSGILQSWGCNSVGQLGNGTTVGSLVPAPIMFRADVKALSCGYMFSVVLLDDGTVMTWGSNDNGQIGDGTTEERHLPVKVTGLSDVKAISAGGNFCLALKNDGSVWAWGYNRYGQLGDGTQINRLTPIEVPGMSGVKVIGAGHYHSLAVKDDGSVWAWGYNYAGEIGDGTTTDRHSPVLITGISGAVGVAGGAWHSLAVKSDGSVWAWGGNFYGELGDGTCIDRHTPVQVQYVSDISTVSAEYHHNLAVTRNGALWSWGDGWYGALGTGCHHCFTNTPVLVSTLADVTMVSTGDNFCLAVTNDNTLWAWGSNNDGQLGDGTNTDRYTPVTISSLTEVKAVAAGAFHSIAYQSFPTHLAYSVQPGSAHEGFPFGTQPVVVVKRNDGTTAMDFSGPMTVSIKPGTGAKDPLLNGTTTVNCVDGIATFTNLSIDKWGTGYVLTATSPGSTSADSAAFDVAPVAKYLGFTISPFYPMAGSRFQQEPTVYVMGSDDRAINYDGPITLSIKSGTGTEGAVLNGTTTVNCVEYYAIFTDLSIDKAGHNYVLTATSPGLMPGDSEAFDVAEAASSLVFEVQPGRWRESGLETQPVVAAEFSDGTTAIYFSGPVTVSIKPGSGTPGAVLGGNKTKGCIDGRATYENLSIDKAGAGYVLTASSPGLASGDSQPFDVVTRYTVYAWGLNEYGQLGDGTVDERHTPTALTGLVDVISVDGGTSHSLAVTEEGHVWAWGYNYYGQLGDGSTTDSLIPVQVPGLAGVRQVSAGGGHSLSLTESGVQAWGWNTHGQLGDGTQTRRTTPVPVPDLSDVKAVSAGYYHSLALKNDGTVWAWGGNTSGQLGDGTLSMRKSPVQVLNLSGVKAISAGNYHSLALKDDGSVWAWGLNNYGQLGNGTTDNSLVPVQVTALTDVTAVVAGGFHSLAVKTDGTVLAFGADGLGPTGDLTPVPVAGLAGAISASGGDSASFVMCDDRSLWAWGYNSCGQLGDGTTVDHQTPVRVLCPAGIIAIGAGGLHGLAVGSSVLTRPFTVEEARDALSISGGLSTADRIRFDRLNTVFTGPSAGIIDIIDVARIARKASGLEANP